MPEHDSTPDLALEGMHMQMPGGRTAECGAFSATGQNSLYGKRDRSKTCENLTCKVEGQEGCSSQGEPRWKFELKGWLLPSEEGQVYPVPSSAHTDCTVFSEDQIQRMTLWIVELWPHYDQMSGCCKCLCEKEETRETQG